jgi:hypothetical protein
MAVPPTPVIALNRACRAGFLVGRLEALDSMRSDHPGGQAVDRRTP